VCVRVKGGGYLDPCTWSPSAPTVQINAGQTVKGYRAVTQKGAIVKVRVNDSDHVLGTTPAAGAVAPHVLIGVFTRHHTFEPAVKRGSDANGSDHEATVPPGEATAIHVTGQRVQITDLAGNAVSAAGTALPVTSTLGAAPPQVTVNVKSAGN
jgi:hypothetical protein